MSSEETRLAAPQITLTWRDRRRLTAAAKADAYRRKPALDLGVSTFTTGYRISLMTARDVDLTALRRERLREVKPTLKEWTRLTASLPSLKKDLQKAQSDLQSVTDSPPTAARSPYTSPQVAQARQSRAVAAAIAQSTARVSSAQRAIADTELKIIQLRTILHTANTEWQADVDYLCALAEFRRAVFDRVLLRHHRHGDLLDTVLERQVPPVPKDIAGPLVLVDEANPV